MKKIVSILLAVLMLTAMFAGCAKKEAASPDAPAPTDAHTVAVGAVIIARDDIPEDDVYKLVSTIFDNKDAITEQHAKGGELDLDFAASVTSVPYHPGAARYFEEQGKKVASVKEGAGQGAGPGGRAPLADAAVNE